MERFIDKVAKVYQDSTEKANEVFDVFIKDTIYPKVEEAAKERKDKAVIVLPEEYTTIAAIRYISHKLSAEGFSVFLSEKEGKLRVTVSGWNKVVYSPAHEINSMIRLMFGL